MLKLITLFCSLISKHAASCSHRNLLHLSLVRKGNSFRSANLLGSLSSDCSNELPSKAKKSFIYLQFDTICEYYHLLVISLEVNKGQY